MRLSQLIRFGPLILASLNINAQDTTTLFAFGTEATAKQIMPRLQNIAEAIIEKSEYNWVPLASLLGEDSSEVEIFSLAKAEKKLTSGTQNFGILNLERAKKDLLAAKKQFEASLNVIDSLKPLAETNLYLGLIAHLQNHLSLSRAYFSQALAFDENVLNRKMQLLPSQRKLFEQVRKNRMAGKKISIAIRTSPPNAALKIDGKYVTNQGEQLVPTSSSQHLLQASLAGYKNQGKLVQFSANTNQIINLNLEPAARQALFDKLVVNLSKHLEAPYVNPAKKLRVDEVLWLGGSRSGQALTIYAGFASKNQEHMIAPQFRVFLVDRPTFINEFELWIAHLLKQNRLAKRLAKEPNPNWIEPQAKLWIKSEVRPALGQNLLAYSAIPFGLGITFGIIKGALPTSTENSTKQAWNTASNVGLIAGGALAGIGLMTMLMERP